MKFKKGMTPWNKGNGNYMEGEKNHFFGKHHTEETKKIIKEKNKGKESFWKGKKLSDEHKNKLKENHWTKNDKLNKIIRKKIGLIHKGKIPWSYIDGRSNLMKYSRYGKGWNKIKKLIKIRDEYKCKFCGDNKKLHIHHKIPFLLTFDNSLNNLITLCESCHRKEDALLLKKYKQEGVY